MTSHSAGTGHSGNLVLESSRLLYCKCPTLVQSLFAGHCNVVSHCKHDIIDAGNL